MLQMSCILDKGAPDTVPLCSRFKRLTSNICQILMDETNGESGMNYPETHL